MKKYKEQNLVKNQKKESNAGWRNVCLLLAMVALGLFLYPRIPALAATPTPTPPPSTPDFSTFQPVVILNVLRALFLTIVALIGYIIVGKSAMEIGAAIQQSDNAGIISGLKGLVGGGIMAGIGTLMVLFGFII